MQAIWKGAVSFGLVHVPVKMYPATEDRDIPLRMLHREYKEPIQYRRTCPKCEQEVPWSDIVKGYEYEKGHFVTFEQEELEQLAAETSHEIRILNFVDMTEIDPIYYQRTFYLSPEETGEHAYRLLVRALEATRKIGVAQVTIRQKSSLAAVRVVDGVLSLVTMFYAEEFRDRSQIPNLPEEAKVDRRELDMAKMLIDQLTGNFEPEKYRDEYKERLTKAIEDKIEGRDIGTVPEVNTPNVLDLMDALQASLKLLKPLEETGKGDKAYKRRRAKNQKNRTGA
ncbi:Ku protein [Paenibacillus sp. NFR01]|uniref:non-homologous end joining protein Ku n=1 Tax=Paenibacillus sp. NFR01 TaxID=1566279 RepID=UPI0008B4FE33|nr:Ku protein [Paenibacillus sp. NFR01]SET91378.1 DNA end-binding protein Ku [Paenibacillus sp. NFR01]